MLTTFLLTAIAGITGNPALLVLWKTRQGVVSLFLAAED